MGARPPFSCPGTREHPFGLPQPEELPTPRDQIEAWRATKAGQLALRIYADHRVV